MDRFAIFIDAGYFFSAGAQAVQNKHIPRKLISLTATDSALSDLIAVAKSQVGGMPLLRAYWYDAMPGSRPSLEQSTIAMLPFAKLRLGVLNNVGEQKGVDSLIVTDLIELARNKAIADAVIVSGDEDLRIAVQVAQTMGVRVHILAAGDPKSNVSASLQMEADSVQSLDTAWFTRHLTISNPVVPAVTRFASPGVSPVPMLAPTSPRTISVPQKLTLDAAAEKVCKELFAASTKPAIDALKQHFTTSNSVPTDFDGRLIAKTATAYGAKRLSGDEMRQVRGIFVKTLRAI